MAAWIDNPLLDGRFLFLGVLGEGGMGRVYRAFDRVEERTVALKVPFDSPGAGPPHPLTVEFETWFRLRHPNIVRVYELSRALEGPLRPGTPYMVLESFPGRPAHQALVPGRVDPAYLETLARGVLQALEHVHLAGVVHRDLKPSNILVSRSGNGRGRTKLIDFGLASPMGQAGEPGRLSGSVRFVAPETVLGAPMDGRADLYGFGIVMFFLATGTMPVESADPGEVLRWHLEGPPLDPRSLAGAVPERLARLIGAVTSRDPGERPLTATEALIDLGEPRRGPLPAPSAAVERWRVAVLRLALDAVALGERRLLELPRRREAFEALLQEAEVLSHRRGLRFCRLGRGPERGSSNLGRVLLRLLVGHESDAGPVGPSRALLEGRRGRDPRERRRIAGEVARFILASCRGRAVVLAVERGALADPVALDLVGRLAAATGRDGRRGPGLLLVLPAGVRGRLGADAVDAA